MLSTNPELQARFQQLADRAAILSKLIAEYRAEGDVFCAHLIECCQVTDCERLKTSLAALQSDQARAMDRGLAQG